VIDVGFGFKPSGSLSAVAANGPQPKTKDE
jgi:hypothetical protein